MMTWQSLNSSRNRVLHHTSGSVRLAEWDLGTILKSAEFLDSTNFGIVLQDPQGEILECNRVAAEFFAMSIDDLTGTSFHSEEWGAVHEDSTPFAIEERPEIITLNTGQTTTGTVIGFNVAAKARRWLTVNTCPAIVNNSRVGVISSFVDITSQIQREHTMRLMRGVSKFAMSTNTETELLQHLCDEMISLSDYSLAWIGEPSDSEPGLVNICFSAGKNAYLYDDIVSTLASKESGMGPT